MKVAVTGASGFVGRYVLAELSSRGIDIIAASRTPPPHTEAAQNVRWVELNLGNPADDIFQQLGCPDVLIHLAWEGLPNYKSPFHFETNLPQQYNFLKSCIQQGIGRITITGTCLEYGLQHGELCETIPPQPTTPYGFAKDSLRRQLEFLQPSLDFNLTWLRLFYIYGEGQMPNSLLSQLESALRRGETEFKMSPGEQLRDFIRVEDAARLIVDLALKKQNLGIVNICSGSPVSVRSFVENYLRESNREGLIQLKFGHFPYLDYESMAFWGSKKKLQSLL